MTENLNHWMIRTSGSLLLGPFTREQISDKVINGQLGAADEICPGNGYWMALYEKEEIEKRLEIRIPLFQMDIDEVTKTDTQTQTQTATDVSDLNMMRDGMTVMAMKNPNSTDLGSESVDLSRVHTGDRVRQRKGVPFASFWFVSGVLLFMIILWGIRLRST